MPIHPPGQKFRNYRMLKRRGAKREVGVVLSLTAMVDMFTVVVVFLLQNYNVVGNDSHLPKEIVLPKATQVNELTQAVVVTISPKEISLENAPVISYEALKAQGGWMVEPLRDKLQVALAAAKGRYEAVKNQDDGSWSRVTVRADKEVDILTVKKVMYTAAEAGAGEINFAVNRKDPGFRH